MLTNKPLSLLLFILYNLILFSCNKGIQESTFIEDDFPEYQHLNNGDILINEDANLLDSRWIKYHPDSFLVLLELGSEKHIKIIDLKDHSVQEIIKKGRGPEELEGAWGINVHNKDIWVFGINQGKLIKLSPTSHREFEIAGALNLEDPYIMSGVMIDDTNFLAINETDNKNRLALYNQFGELVKKFGSFPSSIYNNPDENVNNDVFMATISASSNGKHAILGCTRTDIIEVFNLNNGSKVEIRGPYRHDFNVEKVNTGGMTMVRITPNFIAYSHSCAHDEYFYISYNGKLTEEIKSTSDFLPNQIFQFSWDGNPIKRLEFGHPIIAFDINPENNQLYCIDHAPVPVIRTYNLSK